MHSHAWGKAWGSAWGPSWGRTRQDGGSVSAGYRIDRTKPIERTTRARKNREQDIILIGRAWTF